MQRATRPGAPRRAAGQVLRYCAGTCACARYEVDDPAQDERVVGVRRRGGDEGDPEQDRVLPRDGRPESSGRRHGRPESSGRRHERRARRPLSSEPDPLRASGGRPRARGHVEQHLQAEACVQRGSRQAEPGRRRRPGPDPQKVRAATSATSDTKQVAFAFAFAFATRQIAFDATPIIRK